MKIISRIAVEMAHWDNSYMTQVFLLRDKCRLHAFSYAIVKTMEKKYKSLAYAFSICGSAFFTDSCAINSRKWKMRTHAIDFFPIAIVNACENVCKHHYSCKGNTWEAFMQSNWKHCWSFECIKNTSIIYSLIHCKDMLPVNEYFQIFTLPFTLTQYHINVWVSNLPQVCYSNYVFIRYD